jgi:hypothetical protein
MKHYLVIDKNGTGFVTRDKQMAEYARIGAVPRPYKGVSPLAHALLEMHREGDIGPVETVEIDISADPKDQRPDPNDLAAADADDFR